MKRTENCNTVTAGFLYLFYDKSYSIDPESIWQSAFGDEPYVLGLTWARPKAKLVATETDQNLSTSQTIALLAQIPDIVG